MVVLAARASPIQRAKATCHSDQSSRGSVDGPGVFPNGLNLGRVNRIIEHLPCPHRTKPRRAT